MATSIAPVAIRVRAGGAESPAQPFRFTVPGRDGGFVLEADVSPAELAAARARWRAMTRAAVLGVVAVALLLCTGPLIDLPPPDAEPSRFLALTRCSSRSWSAHASCCTSRSRRSPDAGPDAVDLLLTTLAMAPSSGCCST